MVMLSVIMSYSDNFIGSERGVLWDFLARLQPFFHCSKNLLTPDHGISQNPPHLSMKKGLASHLNDELGLRRLNTQNEKSVGVANFSGNT